MKLALPKNNSIWKFFDFTWLKIKIDTYPDDFSITYDGANWSDFIGKKYFYRYCRDNGLAIWKDKYKFQLGDWHYRITI